MKSIFGRAVELFAAGGVSGAEAFRLVLEDEMRDALEMILDLKYALVEDPMEPDYEALGNDEPTSQYADSRDSAESPAIQ